MDGIKCRRPEEMRDSGVEWLNNIPLDWDCIRLKYLSRYKASNVDKLTVKGEYPVSLCNYVDVYKNVYITDELNFMQATATKQEIKNFTLNEGYILITKDSESPNDIAIPAYVPKKLVNVLCGYHLSIIDANQLRLSSKYLFQFLNSIGARNYFENRANGITRYALGMESFKNILIPDCDLLEQQKIANFLDIKTAQFDSIISKKELLIEKLEEAKKCLISEVVTGKIKIVDGEMVKRKPGEMKDSGVEWLGMIPKEWKVATFRRVCKLKQGLQINKSKRFIESGPNRYTYITIKYLNSNNKYEEVEFIQNPDRGVICNKEEILFARTGATGTVITDVEGVFHNNFFKVIYDNNLVDKNYLVYYLNEKSVMETLLLKAGTTTIPDLNHNDFLDTEFLLNGLCEQKQITEFLDQKISQSNMIITKIKSQIQKLKGAKQSLISEAVTGKIDLRDWEIIEEGLQ